MSEKIKVTLVKSVIGSNQNQRRVVETLGLRKLNSSVVHNDTPNIRGMVHKINHLVMVEKIDA
ncbi:LSU ribosomal protein L30P [Desulfonispora thiosulfatigenes DSM 11270]|uniref:Large ribosomal subunit protein uL30 n=1 Tax=Desulfonispora thiosulfatigenes DSM 11270 TaxID=656914 RepID=A0A1W1USV2_DESTI|nr:50S ribosomal protein L30 [Desulfonispora thiosulfatigenes]SMB83804.1 LSU ribosomal protein L30P [Desulfonispora thiosulfatigenes DSM 11270]